MVYSTIEPTSTGSIVAPVTSSAGGGDHLVAVILLSKPRYCQLNSSDLRENLNKQNDEVSCFSSTKYSHPPLPTGVLLFLA
jgi:hypothetical protein